MRKKEEMKREKERKKKVGGKDYNVIIKRRINTVLHDNDPRWGIIPRSAAEVGGLLSIAEHGS